MSVASVRDALAGRVHNPGFALQYDNNTTGQGGNLIGSHEDTPENNNGRLLDSRAARRVWVLSSGTGSQEPQ